MPAEGGVMTSRPPRHRVLERRKTRDARVPRSDDDREMEHSWRCIPVRPTADDDWFVLDSSHNRSTTWGRRVFAEGRG
jgi:hypothetical protein